MRILHVLPRPEATAVTRTSQLLRIFGGEFQHTLWGEPEQVRRIASEAGVNAAAVDLPYPEQTRWQPGALHRLAREMLTHDLVVTHGFAAMTVGMARTIFSKAYPLPPLVHHEWDHQPRITTAQRRRRNWYRRIALGRAAALIVDCEPVRQRALSDWDQPPRRVHLVPDAVDLAAFAKRPRPDALPRVVKRPDERWAVLVDAGQDPAPGAAAVSALAAMPGEWHLVRAGASQGERAVADAADATGIIHRVHTLPANLPLAALAGLADIVLVTGSHGAERAGTLAAMAAGKPVLPLEGTGAADMLSPANRQLLAGQDRVEGALAALSGDESLRRRIGVDNQQRAREVHDLRALGAFYRGLFDSALALRPRPEEATAR
ncbi:glycosyltransferase [Qipengyuania thermophila]|uniref:glycosyltransferase n=1 Tax=Qipengyuania thermophila TaxID=2509361 RepID=UPI0013EA7257|nr:glycosyltransferase [Qipengyuania thermophila]